ncbi:pentatricopeptide repeat-containing protein ELI1, chloroplastic-like [Zingiber officinale]|uniref:DYW domain-containing protein n=1 Tax=Zingiber officinale TaxID=94328 RepID=A0A8J5GR85_ZINOF|nr:pentatricopeptide repeat-containing protein ELI1, chloroplastic-like [Zingiber officinale]KAG6512360.1 hypothetical protein ZIOFF_030471 [Zingiber officinale]
MSQLLQLHARLITSPPPPEAVDPNLVAVKLICAAAERSDPRHAALVFHVLRDPNIVAWNSLLRALALHRLHPAALHHFRRLLASGSPAPDEFTFTSVLKACAGLLARSDGEMAHALVLRRGFASNVFVGNSLIDMYFKFGRPDNAQSLFDEMLTRDVVTWNSLLSGYCSRGHLTTARRVFDEMPERSMISLSAMIIGYAQTGNLDAAREIFDEAIDTNVGCWNAMISGYAQNQKFSKAIALFRQMLNSHSVEPNEVTLVSVLSACAHSGALNYGRCIYRFIETKSMRLSLFLGNALADMYAKCGCIAEAKAVFGKMKERDVISWNTIITALAMHGHSEEAISMFHKMLDRSLRPNDITFMGILSACTHAGLVDAGLRYFDTMIKVFEVLPQVEHYGCIVDLLSRSGRLDEAEDLVNSMRVAPNEIVWGALLGGCKIYKDTSRGERVVQRILELDPKHTGSYVYLANLYDRMGRFDDAAKLSSMMRNNGVVKTPGCSWIEVDNTVHEFLMGDRSHPQTEKIYAMVSTLSVRMKLVGYAPDTTLVTQRIDEEEKENALSMHSEKLAVAFGLISTKDHSTIRVVKNLRVCDDCHRAMKVISNIVGREIVLRDRSRFHHFKEGQCSCKDYW